MQAIFTTGRLKSNRTWHLDRLQLLTNHFYKVTTHLNPSVDTVGNWTAEEMSLIAESLENAGIVH